MRTRLGAVAVLSLTCMASFALAESATPLPARSLADMAIDDRHGQVFITQFGSTVEVLDFAGNPVTSIPGQSSAAGMALNRGQSRLYVAQRTGDAIVEISTKTLRERRRLTLGLAGACPLHTMTLLGSRLWFGFTCTGFCACQPPSARGGIASVRVRRGTVQTFENPNEFPYYQPLVAGNRRLRDVLVAGEAELSPTTLYRYRVSRSGVPMLEARSFFPGSSSNLQDMAVLASTSQLLTASGAPYHVNAFALDDFSSVGTYETGPYPNSVAITRDERFVAAGRDAFYEPDVYVYPAGSDVPVNAYELGLPGAMDLAPGGLAFDADGAHLFAVMAGFDSTDHAVLHVIDAPLVPTSSTTTTTTTSTTTTTVLGPCGGAAFPQCAGNCPAGESCTLALVSGVGGCTCAQDPPCGFSGGTCGGNCPAGSTCTQIHVQTCACEQTPEPTSASFTTRVAGRAGTSDGRNHRNHSTPWSWPAVESQFGCFGSCFETTTRHEPSRS